MYDVSQADMVKTTLKTNVCISLLSQCSNFRWTTEMKDSLLTFWQVTLFFQTKIWTIGRIMRGTPVMMISGTTLRQTHVRTTMIIVNMMVMMIMVKVMDFDGGWDKHHDNDDDDDDDDDIPWWSLPGRHNHCHWHRFEPTCPFSLPAISIIIIFVIVIVIHTS